MTGLLAALALSAWSPQDTKLELAFVGLVAADAGLTHYALGRPGFTERNPLLGTHPSPSKVWAMAGIGAASHALVSRLLPEGSWRTGWQVGSLAIEFSIVAGNTALVVGGKF